MTLDDQLLGYARELAKSSRASAVLVYADVTSDFQSALDFIESQLDGPPLFLVTSRKDLRAKLAKRGVQPIVVPGIRLTRMGLIKMAVLIGREHNLFKSGDRLVCLSGLAETGRLDTLVMMEVGDENETSSGPLPDHLTEHISTEVFERVLDLATALGNEGREGRPVGAAFVIGDSPEVLQHSVQMVLNPFHGYPLDIRNVLDPTLEMTIKEFSAIDGAFIITADGYVERAGAYLKPASIPPGLPGGMGSRHLSAAGITAQTKAVAVVVSESTGTVTVFHKGRIVIEVEARRHIGPHSRRLDEFVKP